VRSTASLSKPSRKRGRVRRPECGDHETTVRHRDTLTCPCGFEGHADLTASETFLRENSDTEVRPMARPVQFEWDDHEWSGKPYPMKVPKKCARTRKLPRGSVAEPLSEESRASARGGCQTRNEGWGGSDNETIDCSLFRRHSGCPYVCTWGSLLRGLCGRRGFPRAEGGTCVASGGAYFSFTTRRRRRAGRLVRLGRRRSLSHISVRVQQGPAAGRSPRSAPWNISVTTLTIVRRESPRRR